MNIILNLLHDKKVIHNIAQNETFVQIRVGNFIIYM